MNYFIKDITTYRPANKKCAEIVEFVEKYKDGLIYDKVSRDEFVTEIRRKVEILNNAYPRTKRLVVVDGGYEQVFCYPEGGERLKKAGVGIHVSRAHHQTGENKTLLT